MAKRAIADSCYCLGLVDPSDQHHEASIKLFSDAGTHELLIPWPCLYETVSTRLVKQPEKLSAFEKLLPTLTRIDDSPYREFALEKVFEPNFFGGHPNLTDWIIRAILSDDNLRIDALITFNHRDFKDVCWARGIEIIPHKDDDP